MSDLTWVLSSCKLYSTGIWVAAVMQEAVGDEQVFCGHERYGWGHTPRQAIHSATMAWTLPDHVYAVYMEEILHMMGSEAVYA